eukprot:IDg17363t1
MLDTVPSIPLRSAQKYARLRKEQQKSRAPQSQNAAPPGKNAPSRIASATGIPHSHPQHTQARALQDALAGTACASHQVDLNITTSAHLRRLSRRYGLGDATTDVLSFASQEGDDHFATLARDPY